MILAGIQSALVSHPLTETWNSKRRTETASDKSPEEQKHNYSKQNKQHTAIQTIHDTRQNTINKTTWHIHCDTFTTILYITTHMHQYAHYNTQATIHKLQYTQYTNYNIHNTIHVLKYTHYNIHTTIHTALTSVDENSSCHKQALTIFTIWLQDKNWTIDNICDLRMDLKSDSGHMYHTSNSSSCLYTPIIHFSSQRDTANIEMP